MYRNCLRPKIVQSIYMRPFILKNQQEVMYRLVGKQFNVDFPVLARQAKNQKQANC